jgi:hypothetical protein
MVFSLTNSIKDISMFLTCRFCQDWEFRAMKTQALLPATRNRSAVLYNAYCRWYREPISMFNFQTCILRLDLRTKVRSMRQSVVYDKWSVHRLGYSPEPQYVLAYSTEESLFLLVQRWICNFIGWHIVQLLWLNKHCCHLLCLESPKHRLFLFKKGIIF